MDDFTAEDLAPQTSEDFAERKDCLVEELKDCGIPRELWSSILDGAEGIETDAELDEYVARMQKNFNS